MATGATLDLRRRMLVDKWPLLVGVALDASGINAHREPCLFLLKAAVWIMAIAALHRSFENLVMKGRIKLRLHLAMTTHAELRFPDFQQVNCREAGFLSVRLRHEDV